MKYLILSSDKQRFSEVVAKMKTMPLFDTYIGTCWGALIAVFASLQEWSILQSIITNSRRKSLLLRALNIVKMPDLLEYYSYNIHEKLINSPIQVRVPLLDLNSKELRYFILNDLTYNTVISVLKSSLQTVWDKPLIIKGVVYIEPSIFDSHCFYHILAHDKDSLPNKVEVLFPLKNNEHVNDSWLYKDTKTVLSRILYITRMRNLKRCTFEIKTLAEANSVEINYNYLD